MNNTVQIKSRPFLKWAGGKYKVIDFLTHHFPQAEVFVEPFVGAGSVFLNTNYKHYILSDVNSDLINLYKIVQKNTNEYIKDARELFRPANNDPDIYYGYREKFNKSEDSYERAVIFLYLNKFGFNGLCRYNQKGLFNVPFGKYLNVRFDADKILYFAEKSQKATFYDYSFEKIFEIAPKNSVIYCDPPYAPLPKTVGFTSYHTGDFGTNAQKKLASLAKNNSTKNNNTVLISNHDIPHTREWYQEAELHFNQVRRLISSQGKRPSINELLAIYRPKNN